MNQKGAAVAFLVLIVSLIGAVIAYDIIKNDRLHINGNQSSNWQWEDDWNKDSPQPQQPQSQKPNEPVKPDTQTNPKPEGLTASSYQEAITLADKHQMSVIVVFGAEWCGWCKKLKSETLATEEVKMAMKNYIFVQVDVDKDRDISRKFGVSGIPAYVITNSKEATLKKGAGYKKASEFVSWINNTQKTSWWWLPW